MKLPSVVVLVFVCASVSGQAHSVSMGLGMSWESANSSRVSSFVDWTLGRLWGMHAGLEFQADVKAYSHGSYDVTSSDVGAFGLGASDWAVFSSGAGWRTSYSLWDGNVSPRVFLSWDQLVRVTCFLGVDYDVEFTSLVTKIESGQVTIDGRTYTAGQTYSTSHFPPGSFLPVAGVRLGFLFFYVDYTRFLVPSEYGDYSWRRYDKDRWGAGIQARF